ncbi:MAG: hypothetical protein L0K27_10830 [Corynebacterium nuruki]|nr:hypothetical protein [Corynebacterium nuruki]
MAYDLYVAAPDHPRPAEALSAFADLVNRGAVAGAVDPDNPPADRRLRVTEYPVAPSDGVLTVAVPYRGATETLNSLQNEAARRTVRLTDIGGRVLVETAGGESPFRMRDRAGTVHTFVDAASVRRALAEADGWRPAGMVLSVSPADDPTGANYLRVGIVNRRWTVHLRTGETVRQLADLLDRAETAAVVVDSYLAGDVAALEQLSWADISLGMVADTTNRWRLDDSAGGLTVTSEEEVREAVTAGFAGGATGELDWLQVSDQTNPGDYITADRHLGTQWCVMWGHGYGEERYWRTVVDSPAAALDLLLAWTETPEDAFLAARDWELVIDE